MTREELFEKYEIVVGLEVHAQLLTRSKAFSREGYVYGGRPNSQTSVVSLAHPGTLPVPNYEALRMAIKMGLACNCKIEPYSHFSRKNYFYADLPKGYQITQYVTPICTGGHIAIFDKEGNETLIRLDKIIMEEDSGKSSHELDPFHSLIDLNRAGVPLIEIVSQPDIRLPEQAYAFLTEVRQLVRYLEICDGNMEEGSLRCDANVSIRPRGYEKLMPRCEIKNINSIRNVQKAIEAEAWRQMQIVEQGGHIPTDTRGFDPVKNETFAMRTKELANDYRYFPEPDIPPLRLKQEQVDPVAAEMPELPRARRRRLIEQEGLSAYDAGVITADKGFAMFFDELLGQTGNAKAAANWAIGPVKSYLNQTAKDIEDFELAPAHLAELIKLVEDGKVSFSIASTRIFPAMLENHGQKGAAVLAEEMNLVQVDDDAYLLQLIDETLALWPDKVAEYRAGKKGVVGLFMGDIMKKSKGKADPKKTNQLLIKALEAQ